MYKWGPSGTQSCAASPTPATRGGNVGVIQSPMQILQSRRILGDLITSEQLGVQVWTDHVQRSSGSRSECERKCDPAIRQLTFVVMILSMFYDTRWCSSLNNLFVLVSIYWLHWFHYSLFSWFWVLNRAGTKQHSGGFAGAWWYKAAEWEFGWVLRTEIEYFPPQRNNQRGCRVSADLILSSQDHRQFTPW